MRLAALFLLLFHSLASAQAEGLVYDRPMADMLGSAALPMMLIDENTLTGGLFETAPFPTKPWQEAKDCVAKLSKSLGAVGDPPSILLVPGARTLRVRDMTLDSLNHSSQFSAPTIAYSLVRSNAVVIVERYRTNLPILRHEAVHFILWRLLKLYGHPDEYFMPCDKAYPGTEE